MHFSLRCVARRVEFVSVWVDTNSKGNLFRAVSGSRASESGESLFASRLEQRFALPKPRVRGWMLIYVRTADGLRPSMQREALL